MRALLIAALVCSVARAQVLVSVRVDQSDQVIRVSTQPMQVIAGTTIVPNVAWQPEIMADRSDWTDPYGRCAWKLVAGVVTPNSPPKWCTHLAIRAAHKKKLMRVIDDVQARVIILERWQADHAQSLDRSDELTEAQTNLTTLIDILTGP